jgi:prolyl oligopeptidase
VYPPARRVPLVETIHGVSVPDPYRWLEDAASPDARAWVDAQNAFTRSRLDGPARDELVRRLAALYDYPRTLTFLRRGSTYFYTHNPGLLDQPILYGRTVGGGEPRVLLDPNRLSADGTTALTAFEVSPDGSRVAARCLVTAATGRRSGCLGCAGCRRCVRCRRCSSS